MVQPVAGNGHNPTGPEVLRGLHASGCKCHFLLYYSYLYQQLTWILHVHLQIPRYIVKAYQNDNFKVLKIKKRKRASCWVTVLRFNYKIILILHFCKSFIKMYTHLSYITMSEVWLIVSDRTLYTIKIKTNLKILFSGRHVFKTIHLSVRKRTMKIFPSLL